MKTMRNHETGDPGLEAAGVAGFKAWDQVSFSSQLGAYAEFCLVP